MAYKNLGTNLTLKIRGIKTKELSEKILKNAAPKIVKSANQKMPKITAGAVTVPQEGQFDRRKNAKKETTTQGVIDAINMRYALVAMIFYKIVSRTPVDEDYVYEVSSSVKQYSMKLTSEKGNGLYYRRKNEKTGHMEYFKRSERKIYEHENGVRFREHKKDDEVIRDRWVLKVGRKTYRMNQFSNCDFNKGFVSNGDISENGEWKKILSVIKPWTGNEILRHNFQTYSITNESPYWEILEYGGYSKGNSAISKGTASKGPDRYHGTVNGYSVQAPRGMVAKTVSEISMIEDIARSGGYKKFGYTQSDFIHMNSKKQFPQGNRYSSSAEMTIKGKNEPFVVVKKEYDMVIDEKSFIESILSRKPTADVYLAKDKNKSKKMSLSEVENDIEEKTHRARSRERMRKSRKIEAYNKSFNDAYLGYENDDSLTPETKELIAELSLPLNGQLAGSYVLNSFGKFTEEQKEWFRRSRYERITLDTYHGTEFPKNGRTMKVFLENGRLFTSSGRSINKKEWLELLNNADEMYD